jgi:HJR/Mrr/RecB family endonuclease
LNDFLLPFFVTMGYEVILTPGGADQGADLIVQETGGDDRIAVQAKRYKEPVGNNAVQELLGGMAYYECVKGIGVTTSEFTRSAKALATKHGRIALWNRDTLANMYQQFLAAPPPFSMEDYNRLKAVEPLSLPFKRHATRPRSRGFRRRR